MKHPIRLVNPTVAQIIEIAQPGEHPLPAFKCNGRAWVVVGVSHRGNKKTQYKDVTLVPDGDNPDGLRSLWVLSECSKESSGNPNYMEVSHYTLMLQNNDSTRAMTLLGGRSFDSLLGSCMDRTEEIVLALAIVNFKRVEIAMNSGIHIKNNNKGKMV